MAFVVIVRLVFSFWVDIFGKLGTKVYESQAKYFRKDIKIINLGFWRVSCFKIGVAFGFEEENFIFLTW